MTYKFFLQNSLSERKTYDNKSTLSPQICAQIQGRKYRARCSRFSTLLLITLNLVLTQLKHVGHYLIRFPVLLHEDVSYEC